MKQKSEETDADRIVCPESRYPDTILRECEADEAILCSVCCKPINPNDPLEFGGCSLACEPCIRAYYKKQYDSGALPNRSAEEREAYLWEEIRSRRYCGSRILKQIRKEQAKKLARRGYR